MKAAYVCKVHCNKRTDSLIPNALWITVEMGLMKETSVGRSVVLMACVMLFLCVRLCQIMFTFLKDV